MISSCFTRTAATQARLSVGRALAGTSGSIAAALSNENTMLRWKSSGGKNSSKSFRPRRAPTKGGYYSRLDQSRGAAAAFRRLPAKPQGPKEPNDIKTAIPRIDRAQARVGDALDTGSGDDLTSLGPLMGGALRALRQSANAGANSSDLESQLKMMDFFTSEDGSTEDLVGARRAAAADTYGGPAEADEMLQRIDQLVDAERFEYMELPTTEDLFPQGGRKSSDDGDEDGNSIRIPHNQLAHGEWGEMLIRTDRVSKMWRGGRVVSFRALVIGGNLRGCGGFGVGKAFEPEGAVEIACRMAKRNIFFVDRYRGRTLTRDLVGRQNSCKVVLRTTTNGLRGNPLCCEILKLLGITNVVAKAHGSRNHYNVVRATFKALLTHESLDEVALKRGLRLVNLQRAKRLGI